MAERIVVLGWGSLLWEANENFDAWHEAWQYDGPLLKLEFSRISRSRSGALTLVIDNQHGVPTKVAYSLSTRLNIEETIEDLRLREKTTERYIGRIQRNSIAASRDYESQRSICAWAEVHEINAAVWTDLPSNFAKKTGEPFSPNAVVSYLEKLDPAGKAAAREYARRAPEFIRTPVRDIIANL